MYIVLRVQKNSRMNSSLCAECVLTEQMGVLDCTGKVPPANLGQVIHSAERRCSSICCLYTDISCNLVRKRSF
jgi:hypothetical protein